MSGKTDWDTGGHSENVHLDAWTMCVIYITQPRPRLPAAYAGHNAPPGYARPLRHAPPGYTCRVYSLRTHDHARQEPIPNSPSLSQHVLFSLRRSVLSGSSICVPSDRYAAWPYDIAKSGGWNEETSCTDRGTLPGCTTRRRRFANAGTRALLRGRFDPETAVIARESSAGKA